MVVDFREISPAGLNVESAEEIQWGEREQGDPLRELYRFGHPFKVQTHLDKGHENVFMTGRFEGDVEARCVRCLKYFSLRISDSFRLTLMPRTDVPAERGEEGEHELEADDVDLAYYDLEQVDLGRVVAEQVLLLLDLYPHCKPDCRGLCPTCGVDRNESACSCESPHGDTRWSALKKIKAGN